MKWARRASDWINSPAVDAYFRGALMLVFLAGALLAFGYQLYGFLYSGEWPTLSIITALSYFEARWAGSPQSWFGLHTVLDHIPLGAAFMAIIWVVAVAE